MIQVSYATLQQLFSPIHTKQLVACNLSQAIFGACNLSVHTVRKVTEIFTCKIFPAKTCRVYDYNNGAFNGRGNCYYALLLLHLQCDIFNAQDSNGIVGHGYCEDKSTEHIKH